MSVPPKHRWFRFSLRTLFVVVAVVGVWLFPQLKWIVDRHRALDWVGTQAEYWRDMPVDQRAHLGADAPWRIRVFGEKGVDRLCVVVQPDAVASRQRELELLFPEASVLVVAPGPGYVSDRAKK